MTQKTQYGIQHTAKVWNQDYLTFVFYIPENGHRVFQNTYEIIAYMNFFFFLPWRNSPSGPGLLIIEDSRSYTIRHTTFGSTPPDEWSARRRHLYLTHNTHNRQIHIRGGIRIDNLSKRSAADPRLRPYGHSNWQTNFYMLVCFCCYHNFIYYTEVFTKTNRNLIQVCEILDGYLSLCIINPFLGAFRKIARSDY